jgi:hypothetical protein
MALNAVSCGHATNAPPSVMNTAKISFRRFSFLPRHPMNLFTNTTSNQGEPNECLWLGPLLESPGALGWLREHSRSALTELFILSFPYLYAGPMFLAFIDYLKVPKFILEGIGAVRSVVRSSMDKH